MFTKSLLMPAGFAALAFSGLMFQIAAHAFSAPLHYFIPDSAKPLPYRNFFRLRAFYPTF